MRILLQEQQDLLERLRRLERERNRKKAPAEMTFEEKAKAIAAVECEPLMRLPLRERPALQKRILLKWHPDKQPTDHHRRLATTVMQEMQNSSEWVNR